MNFPPAITKYWNEYDNVPPISPKMSIFVSHSLVFPLVRNTFPNFWIASSRTYLTNSRVDFYEGFCRKNPTPLTLCAFNSTKHYCRFAKYKTTYVQLKIVLARTLYTFPWGNILNMQYPTITEIMVALIEGEEGRSLVSGLSQVNENVSWFPQRHIIFTIIDAHILFKITFQKEMKIIVCAFASFWGNPKPHCSRKERMLTGWSWKDENLDT